MPKGTSGQASEILADSTGSEMQAGAGGMDGGGVGQAGDQQAETPASFESWLSSQDAAVKALYSEHTKGLKGALDAERAQRNDLTKQLRELGSKLEKGSTGRAEVEKLEADLAAKSREADFIAEAASPEIGCIRPKLAYMVASSEQLWDKYGNPDWTKVREAAPELFRNVNRSGSADGGAGQRQTRIVDMNAMIRRAAGRG